MLLPGLVAIALMPLVIYLMYPPEIKATPNAVDFVRERLGKLGKLSRDEGIMLDVFVVLLLLWAGVPAWIFGDTFKLNSTTTAFVGLSILPVTGVLNWKDVLGEKSAWDTLVWFGALVMMANPA
ncbi:hypothetical protein MELB17_18574 [Marinobacter sp. ELB17]|nr:hypothetical protein MELB17_18574 [Marinobacter sp. ELB17]